MIASAHLAYGAAGGIFIQKYLPSRFHWTFRCLFAFMVGIVSHITLDAWPHWEYSQHGLKLVAILLIEVVIIFSSLLRINKFRTINLIIFLGMVGGAMPDLSLMIWEKLFFWNPFLYFHFFMHLFHGSIPFFQVGLVVQIFLTVGAVIYVRRKSA